MASNEAHRVVIDDDGVRTIYDPRAKWILGLTAVASAVVIVAAVVAMLVMTPRPIDATHGTQRIEAASAVATRRPEAAKSEPTAEARAWTDVRAVHVDRAALSVVEPEEHVPSGATSTEPRELLARDVIPALIAAGEKEGIAAFPPPGTDPPKSGIIVPDDYELPPGYVRHYQVTDDGKRLDAILMFSPDFEFIDQAGRPVPVPANRIVPPEMAPPGLPIRMLELPKEDLGPDRGRR